MAGLIGLDLGDEGDDDKKGAEAPDLESLRTERDTLKAKLEAYERKQGDEGTLAKIAEYMGDYADMDEIRETWGPQLPVLRIVAGEIAAQQNQELTTRLAALEGMQQQWAGAMADTTAQAGRSKVEAGIKDLDKLTGSGIAAYAVSPGTDPKTGQPLPSQLDTAVHALWAKMGYPASYNSAEGYLELAEIANAKLLAAKARQAKSASERKEEAESRRLPGGRSSNSRKSGVTVNDLRGKSLEEQRRLLVADAARRRSSG